MYSHNSEYVKKSSKPKYGLRAVILMVIIGAIAATSVGLLSTNNGTESNQKAATRGVSVNEAKKTITESVELPYKTFREADPSLASGETRTKIHGRSGIKNIVYEVLYEDGLEKSRSVILEEVIENPQDEIVLFGN